MSWRETEVIKYLENADFEVNRTNYLETPGIPDFRVYNFNTGERFYLEVKSSKGFTRARKQKQLNKIRELISEGHTVRLALVEADYIKFEEFDSELNLIPLSSSEINAEIPIVVNNLIICPHCCYDWVSRVEKPKRCPKCQRWLPW